jgi:hypothetical protein
VFSAEKLYNIQSALATFLPKNPEIVGVAEGKP